MRLGGLAWPRRAFAVAFFVGAAYHVATVLATGASGSSSAGRHALFVVINLAVGIGFLWPPPGFVVIIALLCGQQLLSHGETLLRLWQREHRIDWPSVAVLIVMPLAVVVAGSASRHGAGARSA